jgi:hypothetical protein
MSCLSGPTRNHHGRGSLSDRAQNVHWIMFLIVVMTIEGHQVTMDVWTVLLILCVSVKHRQAVGVVLYLAVGLLNECLLYPIIGTGQESTMIERCGRRHETPVFRLHDPPCGIHEILETQGINVINVTDLTLEAILYRLRWSPGGCHPTQRSLTNIPLTDVTYLHCIHARVRSATNLVLHDNHQLRYLQQLTGLL